MTKLYTAVSIFLIALFFLHQKFLPHFLLLKADPTEKWVCNTTQEELDRAKEILQKPLRYLGLGSQCFAFSSEDKNYVVKICKATRYKPISNSKKKERLETDFLSYDLAFNLIPSQSQIVFLHLNQTETINTTIKIIDPLGLPHTINADDYAFYIQRKAIPISEYLTHLEHSEAASFIKELLLLFKTSCQAGLQVRDIQPKNIGIYANSPLWIDPGRIKKKPILMNKEEQEKALRKFSTRITTFLKTYNPNYEALVENELESLL
jgi:hypothetical protein